MVRAIRDTSWLNDAEFNQNLPTGDYMVAWDSETLIPYDAGAFIRKSVNKTYSYSSGSNTPFKRRVNISSVASSCACELKILSEVTWIEKGVNRVVTVEEHIFDWR